MKFLVAVFVCVAVCQMAAAKSVSVVPPVFVQNVTIPPPVILTAVTAAAGESSPGFLMGIYNTIRGIQAGFGNPTMGSLGNTVFGTLTGANVVGLLLTALGLNFLLVPLVIVLFSADCNNPILSSYGILGNIVSILLVKLNPLSLILYVLGVPNIIQGVLDQLFKISCSAPAST